MTPAERAEQIARFRAMAEGDPEDDLAHFRLGQILMEDGQYAEAARAFERVLQINPHFSRVYQHLGECLLQQGQKEAATDVWTRGWHVAQERGDRVPKEAIEKLLRSVGASVPQPAPSEGPAATDTGFRCQRPGCMEGKRARPLPTPPFPDELGLRIQRDICAACWNLWHRDLSIKVINELRLDLSSEFGQAEYDKYMRDFFGFEQESPM
jgi:tetratricopeptide (TPR) repeat protein